MCVSFSSCKQLLGHGALEKNVPQKDIEQLLNEAE